MFVFHFAKQPAKNWLTAWLTDWSECWVWNEFNIICAYILLLSRVPIQMKTKVSSYKLTVNHTWHAISFWQTDTNLKWSALGYERIIIQLITKHKHTEKNRTRARAHRFHTNDNVKIKIREQKASDKAKTTANGMKRKHQAMKNFVGFIFISMQKHIIFTPHTHTQTLVQCTLYQY